MYHYVRPLAHSRYPEIKGLSTQAFEQQIVYIKKHYSVISGWDLIEAIKGSEKLPQNALLLTFDDGYIDHFTDVYPILDREEISGCFFPVAGCVKEHRVLDVNKIHFILASVSDKKKIIRRIFDIATGLKRDFSIPDENTLRHELLSRNTHRYDPPDVTFIKLLLQRELPLALRNLITEDLFRTFVFEDVAAFSRELYMNSEQLKHMQRNGMYIGSHGYEHFWMNTLSRGEQEREIDQSLDLLHDIGAPTEDWIMCYPYGGYNESLLEVVAERKGAVGLTTRVDLAHIGRDHPLELPRLDTNDLPCESTAAPNDWTQKVLS